MGEAKKNQVYLFRDESLWEKKRQQKKVAYSLLLG